LAWALSTGRGTGEELTFRRFTLCLNSKKGGGWHNARAGGRRIKKGKKILAKQLYRIYDAMVFGWEQEEAIGPGFTQTGKQ